MNKDDFRRLQNALLQKIGVTGGWIDRIDSDGVYLYLTWGAVKKLRSPTGQEYGEEVGTAWLELCNSTSSPFWPLYEDFKRKFQSSSTTARNK